MIRSKKVSESIRLGTILTLTGGFMDAYSYLMRGGVFANAETGNIVLMGISAAKGEWNRTIHYLIPVVSFALGVFMAEKIRDHMGDKLRIHWKEGVLWLETVLVLICGLIPQEGNSLVNCMIAFICAMQVEAFRKLRGKAFATTMCTGNLRSGTELLCSPDYKENKEKRKEGFQYYWIDMIFIAGAAIGAFACRFFAEKAIWICAGTLLTAILFIQYHKKEAEV